MRLCWHTEGGKKNIVFAFPPNRLGMHTFSARSEKRAPPCSKRRCRKRSKTKSCYTRGQRKVDRQKEVAPERECRWPERGQEGGPQARRVKRDASPAAQAQARHASSHDASVQPTASKPKQARPLILTSSNATQGDPRRPYVKRHHQTKGRKAEFSREYNLPPKSHTTRLTISRDLL